MAKTKVLIVDDDEFLLEMYAMKFTEFGFQVDTAENGEEAVKKAKADPPDVILMDVVMPKMDGFDLLRNLKKENAAPDAVTLVLTNLGQKDDVEKGMKLGATDYIIKAHFTPSEVVKRVESLLAKKNK
ncbi:MAG: response regulator transcription factor [bacterium]|nr:response regulator transcription factor [bacterium]